jgi:hypothetical protein
MKATFQGCWKGA